MKNRKGFTLVEVIGALAVPLFTEQLNEFRYDYYENLASNFENSGREFFSDNRMYRSTSLGDVYSCTKKTNCSSCHTGHDTCEGGYETCWHY